MIERTNTMRMRLTELMREREVKSFGVLAEQTGIRKATLLALDKGTAATVRLEHIDALCTFFQVKAGDLIMAEPVRLPLAEDVRPGQKGNKHRTEGNV